MRDEMTTAALLIEEDDEDAHYNFQGRSSEQDEDEKPERRTYVMGPGTLVFPNNARLGTSSTEPRPTVKLYAIKKLLDH